VESALFAVAFVVTFGVVPALVAAAIQRRAARARVAFWRQAAGEAGLAGIESWSDRLSGSSGSLQLRLLSYQEGEVRGTRVEIWSRRLAPGLTLRPEPGGLLGSRSRKEIEIGDEDFDKQVSVQGPPALALALLDADMRRTVRTLLRGCLEVRGHRPLWASGQLDDGVLRIDVPERSPIARGTLAERSNAKYIPAGDAYLDGEYKLPQILRAALDLAARLLAPEDLARRLADNQKSEPEPRVRLLGLLTLLREFPEHPATREAAGAARDDPDAEVRVRAGIALGADGRDVLLGVAGGEGAEDATSARAVAALDRSLTLAQTADLLKAALRTRRLATAKVCLGLLGRHAGVDATPILARVLLVEKGELGDAAAQALGETGDAAAEAPLLRALAEGPPGLRRAAAAALGRVGTRAAVAPLHESESRDPALRSAARQAIAEIHSRLGGAAPGQLSLAEGEAGRLSIAEDETGRLSLSDEKGVRS
jgi:hypothetical protein